VFYQMNKTMIKGENLEEMVDRRNKRLLYFFTKIGISVRLVGDPQKPAIIIDEEFVLSGYVQNFKLHFTDKPFGGKIVRTYILEKEPDVRRNDVLFLLQTYEHGKVSKIKLKGTDLFLVGYNFLYLDEGVERHPVFAKFKPKVYFKEQSAIKRVSELQDLGYDVLQI